MRWWTEMTFLCFLTINSLVLLLVAMANPVEAKPQLRQAAGFVANFCLFSYYAAPLSTVVEVIRTRNAITLHPPLVVANGAPRLSSAHNAFLLVS